MSINKDPSLWRLIHPSGAGGELGAKRGDLVQSLSRLWLICILLFPEGRQDLVLLAGQVVCLPCLW